jgi:hypothetical protein
LDSWVSTLLPELDTEAFDTLMKFQVEEDGVTDDGERVAIGKREADKVMDTVESQQVSHPTVSSISSLTRVVPFMICLLSFEIQLLSIDCGRNEAEYVLISRFWNNPYLLLLRSKCDGFRLGSGSSGFDFVQYT